MRSCRRNENEMQNKNSDDWLSEMNSGAKFIMRPVEDVIKKTYDFGEMPPSTMAKMMNDKGKKVSNTKRDRLASLMTEGAKDVIEGDSTTKKTPKSTWSSFVPSFLHDTVTGVDKFTKVDSIGHLDPRTDKFVMTLNVEWVGSDLNTFKRATSRLDKFMGKVDDLRTQRESTFTTESRTYSPTSIRLSGEKSSPNRSAFEMSETESRSRRREKKSKSYRCEDTLSAPRRNRSHLGYDKVPCDGGCRGEYAPTQMTVYGRCDHAICSRCQLATKRYYRDGTSSCGSKLCHLRPQKNDHSDNVSTGSLMTTRRNPMSKLSGKHEVQIKLAVNREGSERETERHEMSCGIDKTVGDLKEYIGRKFPEFRNRFLLYREKLPNKYLRLHDLNVPIVSYTVDGNISLLVAPDED